ncbi:hypothetical protein V8E51_006918 [Hyaloscypha variabilis]
MNEHGSQGQSTVGSELLLGMHGFVGGQSQNSGRAPGLQMQLSVSRGWRRIEVKGEDDGGAPRTKPPSGVRRSVAGVGGSERGESWRDEVPNAGQRRDEPAAVLRTHADEQPPGRPVASQRERQQRTTDGADQPDPKAEFPKPPTFRVEGQGQGFAGQQKERGTTGPHLARALAPPDIGAPLPCTTVERRLVETGNFPDNGGEDIVAWKWKLGPNLVMADQRPSSTACPTVAAHHSLPLATVLEPASAQVYESSSAIGPQVPRRGAGEQGNHLQRMTMHRRGVVGPRERTPRTEPRIALGLVSDMPPSTELRKEGVLRSDSKCRQNSIQAWRCIATTKPQLLALSGTIQDP